jgi:hypothetical protein
MRRLSRLIACLLGLLCAVAAGALADGWGSPIREGVSDATFAVDDSPPTRAPQASLVSATSESDGLARRARGTTPPVAATNAEPIGPIQAFVKRTVPCGELLRDTGGGAVVRSARAPPYV